MRFAIVFTSLLVSVLASPIIKRDVASITAAISEITDNVSPLLPMINNNTQNSQSSSQKVVTLNNTLNSFNPNIFLNTLQALEIEKQSSAVSKSLTSAIQVANASPALNSTDSFTVAVAVVNFSPKVLSLLQNLESRQPVFQKAILGIFSADPLVEKSLKQQKESSAEFGTAVADKLSEPFSGAAPLIADQISSAFDTAIATFAS